MTLKKFQLKDINLQIQEGEYFVILGKSGTGKTVFLETIAGLHRIFQGEIFLKENRIDNLEPEARSLGFVYQNYELFPHMTVLENIEFGLKIKKVDKLERQKRLDGIVGELNIENILHRYPKNLSGGEKQRVALGRALVLNPDIMLLDEPFSALDIEIKFKLQKKLKEIHKNHNKTIIHVTHDIEEALFLGDRIGIMEDGRMDRVYQKDEAYKEPIVNEYLKFQKERCMDYEII